MTELNALIFSIAATAGGVVLIFTAINLLRDIARVRRYKRGKLGRLLAARGDKPRHTGL